ncbi:MAG: peptidase M50 [Planctomycetota bacterium]|nr:MAG: peptidase M50 [Planctomycetota bacterium]
MIEQYALPVTFIAVLLLSLSWHEAAHAWVADKLGDPTARSLGRITLNPIKHMHPVLSVALPAFLYLANLPVIAGGKPVPINPTFFKKRSRDFMLVALAGPGSNLLIALLCGVGYAVSVSTGWIGGHQEVVIGQAARMGMDHVTAGPPSMFDDARTLLSNPSGIDSLLQLALVLGAALNVALAVFNMFPLPPLDGSRVVGWLLPNSLKGSWYRLDRFGIIMVFVVIFYLGGGRVVLGAVLWALTWLTVGVDQLIALLT